MTRWWRVALTTGVLGLTLPVWHHAKSRRRRLALMPVGVSAHSGMTMRQCRRQASLRALAFSEQLPYPTDH